FSFASATPQDLSLIAYSATGSLNAWLLHEARPSPLNWSQPGGDGGRSQRLDASRLPRAAATGPAEAIAEFHLYPSPLRGGIANVHLKLGTQAATRARIRIYDLSGRVVKDENWNLRAGGTQPARTLDLRHLGPDVYSVLCEV